MKQKKIYSAYLIHIMLCIFFIIFAFSVDSPKNIFLGLKKIIINSDILITDYIYLSGIGATFLNSALLGLITISLFIFLDCKPNGPNIMAFWLITGFGFFGKNIFNIWPIIIGVYLYSKYKKNDFSTMVIVAILGTTLAPTVSQIYLASGLNFLVGNLLGFIIGISIGFILTPIAKHCTKVHMGFNLYNVGFAGGIVATGIMSILRAFGYNFDSRFLWHSGSNLMFSILMFSICLYFIILGLVLSKSNIINRLKLINKESGRLSSDFYLKYESICYINMGILGIISTVFVLVIGGSLNGPTMGAIFTMIGFGCFGKNIFNTIPIMIGACISAIVNIMDLNSPSMVLSIMFSTGLAPIAGVFGWKYGILAGFLHVSMVMNIGYLHGGLNLYNNGLACGFVAMLMVPVICSINKKFNNVDI